MQDRVKDLSNIIDSSNNGTEVDNVLIETFSGDMVTHFYRRQLVFEEDSWQVICVVRLVVGCVLIVVDTFLILNEVTRHYF